MTRRVLLATALAALGALTACNNDCYKLATNICECAPNATAIAACNSEISIQNGAAQVNQDDLNRCHQLLQTCDCRSLQSGALAAKVACGLARENPGDRALNP